MDLWRALGVVEVLVEMKRSKAVIFCGGRAGQIFFENKDVETRGK